MEVAVVRMRKLTAPIGIDVAKLFDDRGHSVRLSDREDPGQWGIVSRHVRSGP
jgi:hypothetical protein